MKLASFLFMLAMAVAGTAFAAGADQSKKQAQGKPTYSANVKTMKYHRPDCKFYECRDCTKFFKSPKEAEHAGYQQCKVCWK